MFVSVYPVWHVAMVHVPGLSGQEAYVAMPTALLVHVFGVVKTKAEAEAPEPDSSQRSSQLYVAAVLSGMNTMPTQPLDSAHCCWHVRELTLLSLPCRDSCKIVFVPLDGATEKVDGHSATVRLLSGQPVASPPL